MSAVVAKDAVLYLETKDGELYEIGTEGAEITASSETYHEFASSDFDYLRKLDTLDVSVTFHADLDALIPTHKLRLTDEWRCPYCGHINPLQYFCCGESDPGMGCGHPKTQITEMIS